MRIIVDWWIERVKDIECLRDFRLRELKACGGGSVRTDPDPDS